MKVIKLGGSIVTYKSADSTPPYRWKESTLHYRIKDKEKFSSVTSTDGTCRAQSVASDSDYGQLLKKVKKTTGTGMVLNTSFNIHGEPLVRTPLDAIHTFLRTSQGVLVIGDTIVRKR